MAVAHQHANGHLSSNSRIVVLSQNTAVQLICQSLGIESVELDESLRIPEELDELEKELRTTKSELAKLRNALPSLNIGFANGDVLLQHANFEIRDTSPLAESEIESEIARVSDKFPVFDRSSNGPRLRAKEITRAAVIQSVVDYSRMHEVSPSEVARYNGERQKLIEEYPQYMRNCNDYEREKNLTIEILLEIRNDGTAVADDVDVLLYFPDGFEILTEKQLGANPVAPREPRLRRTMTEELQESIKSVPYLRSDIMRAMMPRIEPPTSLHVERTNSFRVTDHFPNIKHGMQVKLPTLYAVFDSVESANSFECTYELRPANLPVPVTAKLHFIVQKN